MTKVRGENLLIEILLRHAIVTFKVVGSGDRIEDPTRCRVSLQILAEFRKFSRHKPMMILMLDFGLMA